MDVSMSPINYLDYFWALAVYILRNLSWINLVSPETVPGSAQAPLPQSSGPPMDPQPVGVELMVLILAAYVVYLVYVRD